MKRISLSYFGYYSIFFCVISTMLFPEQVVSDDVIPGRFVRNSIQELDVLDQAAVDLLSDKSELFPNLSELERKEKLSDLEQALDIGIADAYTLSRLNSAEITVLTGLHVNVLQRRALGNKPFRTQIKSISERPECKQDLALGRTYTRYSRALSKRNEAEIFLILMDYQNALNCLGGLQARLLAHATGVALWEWFDRIESLDISKETKEIAMASILNPVLMVFDITKYQGPNWLYFSLHRAESISPSASDRLSKLYFYDFITGSLVSMIPRGSISISPLLDPNNIGIGACSLLEMVGAGNETGDYSCGRGLSCSANNLSNVPNPIEGTDLITNNPLIGNSRDNSAISEHGGEFNNARPDFLGETTPYGIPVANLRGNCDGAGTSAAGIGQLANSPGLASFSGCLATALAAAAQDNAASCKIRASQAIAAQQPATIFGTGSNGLPVVRGILGGSECQTDPLAQGPARPISGDPEFDCQTSFECGKENAADFYRSQSGLEFTKQLLHDAADAWADRLRFINSIAGEANVLTDAQQAAVDAAHQQADADAATLAEAGAKSIEESEQKTGLAANEKDVGQTRGSDVVVDKGLPDTGSNQSTLEHEAAHVILNLFFAGKGGAAGVDHHDVMRQQTETYYQRWAQMMVDAKSWVEEQLAAEEEDEQDNNDPPGDQNQTQTPRPDEEYCTALTESMKTLLACTAPLEIPFEAPPGLLSEAASLPERTQNDTFLTPLPDDDGFAESEATATSMFSQCYAQFGMVVMGVDKNGRLIIGGTPDLGSSRCGALDCIPPSVAKSVNGQCQCVGVGPDVGRIYREMGFNRLCATSDFCTPRDDIFSILDRLLQQRVPNQ